MIEINLLPEELKKVKGKAGFSKENLQYIFLAGIGLLLIIHLYFAFSVLVKNFQYKSLNKKWLANRVALEKIADWKKEYNLSSQDSQEITRLTQSRVNFCDKLKVMSEILPEGIWFNHLFIKQKDFRLEASVVSLKEEQMSLIRLFLDELKKDKVFFSAFTRLELGPVNLRDFKGYQIMDFSLEGSLR